MNIILLSGGFDKRLWPISSPKKEKQFINFFKGEKNNPENMIQHVYKKISKAYKSELFEDSTIGKGLIANNCKNVHIYNETDMPIITSGLSNVIISESKDGILINDKSGSINVDKYLDELS